MDKNEKLEYYKVTVDLITKSFLPLVLLIVIFKFSLPIENLIGRVEEAEIGGNKFKIAKQRLETVDDIKSAIEGKSAQEIESFISNYQKDSAGDVIRAYWKPDGTNINKEHDKAIRQWMSQNGIDDTSITFFMRAQQFEDARLKAVKDLNL
jgi:hypothetical protein